MLAVAPESDPGFEASARGVVRSVSGGVGPVWSGGRRQNSSSELAPLGVVTSSDATNAGSGRP
ncbi:hypothetical protein ACSNN7_23480, partial [Micromonospora sp. URMC 105]|uniref:hypothetical protein n=1 Tax=Micromonospora sp. URMC 105 TaxID=3423413 RepID=UPI003F1B7E25